MSSRAVFWDRDGTLNVDPGYLSDPDEVVLLPGVAEALRRVAAAGYENIVVTNQSGVARGLFDESRLAEIHDRLRELLAAEGARVDAIYYCPYLDGDEAVVEAYRRYSNSRKPGPGMLLKASADRGIDLANSWLIGDSLSDAQAGRAAGCRTVVIEADAGKCRELAKEPAVDFVVGSVGEGVDVVLGGRC